MLLVPESTSVPKLERFVVGRYILRRFVMGRFVVENFEEGRFVMIHFLMRGFVGRHFIVMVDVSKQSLETLNQFLNIDVKDNLLYLSLK